MEKHKGGYREGAVAIFTNLVLFGIKLWAGIISGSIALTADAWHTVSDSLSSLIVIIGAKLASGKPDKKHPFGHGRWEPITAIFMGFLLSIIAYNFLTDAIERFREQETASFGIIAVTVTFISFITKAALSRYAFYIAGKSGNQTVKADGWHHLTDALTSAIILTGILFSEQYWWIDSILGGIISLMLFYAVFEIIKDAVNKLLGEKPDPELIARIRSLIDQSYQKNVKPHNFLVHNYINHVEMTFHIRLDDNMNILSGHRIATDIENRISEELNISATIHIEPFKSDYEPE